MTYYKINLIIIPKYRKIRALLKISDHKLFRNKHNSIFNY